MLTDLQQGEAGVRLDRGIDARLRDAAQEVSRASTLTLENAANLMRMIDGLSRAGMAASAALDRLDPK